MSDAPKRFQEMYRDSYPIDRYLFGYGVRPQDVREEDYPVLRALYAAEVTFVDMWIGRLLDRIGELDLAIAILLAQVGQHDASGNAQSPADEWPVRFIALKPVDND